MKIAWFTPFKKASAIGRFSRSVTNQLAKHAQIDLWLADSEDLHETDLRIIPYTRIRNASYWLREYDAVIYNLGDQLGNHQEIYKMSQRVPGIVILHDFVMHHFFAAYYIAPHTRGLEYVEAMRRWYGINDIRITTRGVEGGPGKVWETDEVVRYPLFEEAIRDCTGVITHSEFLRDRVAKVSPVPVRKINLAYDVDRAPTNLSRADLGIPAGQALAITIGHVNENKRVQVVLEALASSPSLRKEMIYVVIGGCGEPFGEQVQELSRRHGLQDMVRFTGFADSGQLRAYLSHADLCINLRLPAMEGASASCIEQMLYGKPVIVTDTGFFSELPDDCVRKVRPAHELEDLTRHLNRLIADRKAAQAMGMRARRYAEESFRPEEYARQVLEFADEVKALDPAFRLADTVGAELRAIGVTPGMEIVDAVAREGALLLDGEYDPPILRTTDVPRIDGAAATARNH
jgi:glycosyltransferase involved in cell wall biosynthesis